MAQAIFCLTRDLDQTEAILDGLGVAGFPAHHISVLFPHHLSSDEVGPGKGRQAREGAMAGGLVGGTLGYLAGLGALTIPGVGSLIASGPIMAGLTGLALGGAVGGVTGALVGAGFPETEAGRYAERVKEGSILVSVHNGEWDQVPVVRQIFEEAGATDISTATEAETGGGVEREGG